LPGAKNIFSKLAEVSSPPPVPNHFFMPERESAPQGSCGKAFSCLFFRKKPMPGILSK
jgi:hypothetical protein